MILSIYVFFYPESRKADELLRIDADWKGKELLI
jgi:hypothetical protein